MKKVCLKGKRIVLKQFSEIVLSLSLKSVVSYSGFGLYQEQIPEKLKKLDKSSDYIKSF